MKPKSVTRYVLTHINKEGMRTLAGTQQGRDTFATREEAEGKMDAIMENNSLDTLKSIWGLPLEVRPVECWPGHFDPKTCWFDQHHHQLDALTDAAEVEGLLVRPAMEEDEGEAPSPRALAAVWLTEARTTRDENTDWSITEEVYTAIADGAGLHGRRELLALAGRNITDSCAPWLIEAATQVGEPAEQD